MFGRRVSGWTALLVAAGLAWPATGAAAPRVLSASVEGSVLTVTVAGRAGTRYAVSVDGIPRGVAAASVRGSTAVLRLSRPVAADDAVTVVPVSSGKGTQAVLRVENRSAPGCSYLPNAQRTPGEGRPDLRRALPATRPLRVTMLFAAPAGTTPSESPQELAAALSRPARDWFAAASYGRGRLEVTPVLRWLPIDRVAAAAAVRAAGPSVDPVRTDAVVVVLPQETKQTVSWAERFPGRVGLGVVLAPHPADGADRSPALWTILTHELGHLLGLPDLYVANGGTATAGDWDPMSRPLGQHLLSWHAYALGWLDPGDVMCVFAGAREATLSAVGSASGTRALLVPLVEARSALVVESRTLDGLDAALPAAGTLVYRVETDAVPGAAPVRVLGLLRPGESLDVDGVQVEALDGSHVRVTRA